MLGVVCVCVPPWGWQGPGAATAKGVILNEGLMSSNETSSFGLAPETFTGWALPRAISAPWAARLRDKDTFHAPGCQVDLLHFCQAEKSLPGAAK